jgi:hypothetical protein
MSRRAFAAFLLAVLGVISVFFVPLRLSQAQATGCSVARSAGGFRGESNGTLVFESADGTLSLYTSSCRLMVTVTRN